MVRIASTWPWGRVRRLRKSLGGGDEGLPLEGAADQVDDGDGEVGEVAEGLVLDLAVLAVGAAEIVAGVGHPLDGVGDFAQRERSGVCVPYPQYPGAIGA